MLDQFSNPDTAVAIEYFSSNVALASGSPERLTGNFIFPESEVIARAPDGPFSDFASPYGTSGRALEAAIPAGDLDGDGAADLFTTSYLYEIEDDSGYSQSNHRVHIHYGTPAPQTTPLR